MTSLLSSYLGFAAFQFLYAHATTFYHTYVLVYLYDEIIVHGKFEIAEIRAVRIKRTYKISKV